MMASPSPANGSQNGNVRNPRRRQRRDVEDGGSLNARQPQRKKSKLSQDTFVAPDHEENGANGDLYLGSDSNGGIRILEKRDDKHVVVTYRTKTAPDRERRMAADTTNPYLTVNQVYSVKKLPCIPDQLRKSTDGWFRGSATASDLALALTRRTALVWQTSSTSSEPHTRVFDLPHPSSPEEPLPFGSLVSTSSTDVGLVVIAPTTGQITYWDNIENSDALSLFKERRTGTQGSTGNLLSGEQLVHLENIEHAGFILIFSSGRTAHLVLKDAQAQPKIQVNFLRATASTSSGGIFGGLRNILGSGSWLKNVVAARSQQSDTRGQMDVFLANDSATFQFWQLGWFGQAAFRRELPVYEQLMLTVKSVVKDNSLVKGEAVSLKLLDFDMSPESISAENGTEFELIALVTIETTTSNFLALANIQIGKEEFSINTVQPLISHDSSLISSSFWRPRFMISKLNGAGFIVFKKTVLLVWPVPSLSNSSEPSFAETLNLHQDERIVGTGLCAEVDGDVQSSIYVFVRNHGIMRIAIGAAAGADGKVDKYISSKTRIEQAVFKGTEARPFNILARPLGKIPITAIENAAIEISDEIILAQSQYISPLSPTIEGHLRERLNLLLNLASYLKINYPDISRVTKWSLRLCAEKMAAACKIWQLYDAKVRKYPDAPLLLPEMIEAASKVARPGSKPITGETNPVRRYFLGDISQIDALIAYALDAVDVFASANKKNSKAVMEILSEADDIVLGGLETAFAFRSSRASLYGLQEEEVRNSTTQSDYEGLEYLWTCDFSTLSSVQKLVGVSREMVFNYFENQDVVSEEPALPAKLPAKISTDNPRLLEVSCKMYEERINWLSAKFDEKSKAEGQDLTREYKQTRLDMLTQLPGIGMVDEGMAIAEKYEDIRALVTLVKDQMAFLRAELLSPTESQPGSREQAKGQLVQIDQKLSSYFTTFGAQWADQWFSDQILGDHPSEMIEQSPRYKKQLTHFLRAKSSRKKLSWMNDIISQRDYRRAADTLLSVATSQEQDLWSQKVELSIAKLAQLASTKTKDKAGAKRHETEVSNWNDLPEHMVSAGDNTKDPISDALNLVNIQDRLYDHLAPTFSDAIDQTAKLQLLKENYGQVGVRGLPSLESLLNMGFESLTNRKVLGAEQMIDVLTLMMYNKSHEDGYGIAGLQTVLSLSALRSSGLGTTNKKYHDMLEKMIWRRCYLRNDWNTFNDTKNMSDRQVQQRLAMTHIYQTLEKGYLCGHWSTWQDAITAPLPSTLLEAGTNPEEHERFSNVDLRLPIAEDVKKEARRLQQYINSDRLEEWADASKALFKEKHAKASERATANGHSKPGANTD